MNEESEDDLPKCHSCGIELETEYEQTEGYCYDCL